jgi:hypothetical protein
MSEPYVYNVTVVPVRWSPSRRHRVKYRWCVSLHWSDGVVSSHSTHRSKVVATTVAKRLAEQRLAAQGSNLRLNVTVYNTAMTTVTEIPYGRDPRSRA